jgi:hypothetical protein
LRIKKHETIIIMVQVTILKNKNERILCVNGEEICELTLIHNAVKNGYDSRDKYYVRNITNSFNVRPFINNARSIKEVIEHFQKLI